MKYAIDYHLINEKAWGSCLKKKLKTSGCGHQQNGSCHKRPLVSQQNANRIVNNYLLQMTVF